MGTETFAELQKAAQQLRDGLKNVDEDIKKLTGRDPSENSRPVSRRVQLKRNSFSNSSRQTEPQAKLKRDSNTTGIRRWGRTLDSSGRTSIHDEALESSGDEDESSKPTIQSVIATELKPARSQTKDTEEDTKTKSRNRRMFGFLVGTLQKFKDETKQKSLGERRREEIEKKLEQKAEEERKEVSSQKKELFQTRREKQQELRMLERKMDNAELKEQVLAHNMHLEQFIRLKSEPPIFYLPVRHNDETTKRLEESKRILKELQESRFNVIDEVDEGFFMTVVNKGVDMGKSSRPAAGVEMRDVGHRNLFDEEKRRDFDKEEDVMMDEPRRENVEWNKMDGVGGDELSGDSRPLNYEGNENEGEGEVGADFVVDRIGVKSGIEQLEGERDMKEGDENKDIQMEEREKGESHQGEQGSDIDASERRETMSDPNCNESLQEKTHEDSGFSGLAESNDVNDATLEAKSDFRTDDEMQQVVTNEDAGV